MSTGQKNGMAEEEESTFHHVQRHILAVTVSGKLFPESPCTYRQGGDLLDMNQHGTGPLISTRQQVAVISQQRHIKAFPSANASHPAQIKKAKRLEKHDI